ncbi:MAG: hypothetical protein ACYDBI_05925 [Thermoplasmataceae archaeon]
MEVLEMCPEALREKAARGWPRYRGRPEAAEAAGRQCDGEEGGEKSVEKERGENVPG